MSDFSSSIAGAIIVLAFIMGPAFFGLWFLGRRKRLARRDRRSPLTGSLLRTPGHALRVQIEEARVDAAFESALLMVVPGLGLSLLYSVSLVRGSVMPTSMLVIVLLGILVFSFYKIRGLMRHSAHLDQLRLGLDAELAAGQELDQLMRQGAVVFHDLPADGFNVDHVVIAREGVFAVETKGYRKPNRAGGPTDARVVFDGQALAFPDWSSSKPIAQAQRQARWLAEWLSSATGEPTDVTPVLALPGWYVDRQGRGPVLVYSGAELNRLLEARTAKPLGAEQMRRVVHQVEQRCRDVEPTYRPDPDDR